MYLLIMLVNDFAQVASEYRRDNVPVVSHQEGALTKLTINYQWRMFVVGLLLDYSVSNDDTDNLELYTMVADLYD